jgi:hypothetical protein
VASTKSHSLVFRYLIASNVYAGQTPSAGMNCIRESVIEMDLRKNNGQIYEHGSTPGAATLARSGSAACLSVSSNGIRATRSGTQ